MTSLGMGVKGLLSVFPLGALAAVIAWFVFVGRYARDGTDADSEGRTNNDKATVSFQAVIAVAALYFLLHHHTRVMMDL